MTEEELWSLSDEELDAAFKEARANGATIEDSVSDEIFDTNEDEVLDLEQPEVDSDDDTSSESDEEIEVTEDSEETTGEPDEEAVDAEEKPEGTEEESEAEEQPAQEEIISFRADGQEYNFTLTEMKEQFGKVFGQAMNYTKKMQALKPHRQTIDALESNGLTLNDVNLMIDVLKGNKEALATVMKRTGVDALELDTESDSNYVPKDYGRNETELNIRDIVDEISSDREYATTHAILNSKWDDASRTEFVKDPSLIRALHIDVKNGMYDRINPIAQKLKLYDGGTKSDLDYYKMAAQQYFDNVAQYENQEAEKQRIAQERAQEAQRIADVKAKQAREKAAAEAAQKRKAAAPTKKASTVSTKIDYLDDSDEAFEAWYNKLQEQQ